jgi:hypothetical protein
LTASNREPLTNALAPKIQDFRAPIRVVDEDHEKERGSDYEDSSDEEFLAMAKTRESPSTAVPVTTSSSLHPIGSSYKRALHEFGNQTSLNQANLEEDNQIFSFESDECFTTPSSSSLDMTPTRESIEEKGVPLLTLEFANVESKGVPIGKPLSPEERLTRSMARPKAGSVGLYKGRTLSWPIVQSPELHDLGAALGELGTFVGGLSGRSGIDEGDSYIFRASLVRPGYSTTPLSLAERLLMEMVTQRQQEDSTSL